MFKILIIISLLFTSVLFSKESEKISLQFQWLDQFQFAGYYVAKEKGFYKDVGLDVELKKYTSGMSTVDEVTNNRANYGVSKPTLIIDKSKGANIKLLAAILQSSPLVLMATKESNINILKDFSGKTMMINHDAYNSVSIQSMLKRARVDEKSLKTIKHSFNVDDLINKKTDLMHGYISNQPFLLKQKGIEINIFNPSDYGFDFYDDILFTSDAEIQNHKQRAINFTNASLKGWEYAFSHIDETVALVLEKYNPQNKSKEALVYEANELKKLAYLGTKEIGKLNVHNIQRIYDAYSLFGQIENSIDLEKFIFVSDGNEKINFTQKETDWIKAHPIVTYSEVNWKPLSIIENGKMTGIMGDYLDLVSKRTGIMFKFIPSNSWPHVLKQFEEKKIDLVPGIGSNEEEANLGLISKTYKTYPMAIVTGKKIKYVNNLDDLNDATIAVPKYYTSYNYITKHYPNIKLITTKDIPEALMLVGEDKADAFIGHIATSLYYIAELHLVDLKIAGRTEFEFEHSFLLQKEQPELLSIVNKAFDSITEQERAKIDARWIDTVEEQKTDYDLLVKSSLVFIFITLLFLYRQYLLKKSNKKIAKIQERQELALVGSKDGLWDWNLENGRVHFSSRWKEMLGYSDDELKNEFPSWEERVHPDDLELAKKGIQANIDGKTDYYEGVHRLKHKNGSWVWILDRAKTVFDQNGKAIRMAGTHTDITAQKELESSALERGKIVDNSINEIYIFDANNYKFLYINRGAKDNTGYTLDEMRNFIPSDIKPLVSESEFVDILKPISEKHEERIFFSTIHQRKDGTRYDADIYLQKTIFESHDAYVAIVLDVTIRKSAEKKLEEQKIILDHQAHHDALTGLPNRVLFNDRLHQAIEKAKRNKSKIALLFIDLDHFKEINDSLGHHIGDDILKEVAYRLGEITRDEDTVARLGGDEFTIILEDLNQPQDASLVSGNILECLSKPININDNILYVSSSIGISIYPDDGITTQNLLKFADSAMYKAKDEGRNNYQYYSAELTELAFERVVMETSLRVALENNEFIVYYQPQVNGTTNKLIGVEALVRWQHPTMGLVSPDKFIPLAEATGLIVKLDRYVMKTAMTQIAHWYEQGLNPGVLAMNLAGKQLLQEDFVPMFKQLIKETNCKAEWLALEVTEGQIMTHPQEAIMILQEISDLGVELAVDDFGTGYSSLAYLTRLPIDKLKIDKAFVNNLPGNEEDECITKAVIALAKSLNLKVIAEGVETLEQRDFIVNNGCEEIQGYFYSKPVPTSELEALLKDGLGV